MSVTFTAQSKPEHGCRIEVVVPCFTVPCSNKGCCFTGLPDHKMAVKAKM